MLYSHLQGQSRREPIAPSHCAATPILMDLAHPDGTAGSDPKQSLPGKGHVSYAGTKLPGLEGLSLGIYSHE